MRVLGAAPTARQWPQHFPPVPERNAEVLEVLISQIAEDRDIDIVLGKSLRVLGHAELFEPVRNLLHGGTASGSRFRYNVPLQLKRLAVSRLVDCRLLWRAFS